MPNMISTILKMMCFERRRAMTIYKISKDDKKKGLKKLSRITPKEKGSGKKDFNDKHDYYITFEELASSIKYGNAKNDKGLYHVNSQFIRVRKGKNIDMERHENVPAKYIACVVSPFMYFSKLEKRGIKIKERDDNKIVYFIPIQFMCSLLPKKYSFTENISTELFEMELFKYTGPVSMLTPLSIFNISSEMYLTEKANVEDMTIRVIV